jgi:hypothetical protein
MSPLFEQAAHPRQVVSVAGLDVLLASVLEVRLVKRVVDGKTERRMIVGRALERNVDA